MTDWVDSNFALSFAFCQFLCVYVCKLIKVSSCSVLMQVVLSIHSGGEGIPCTLSEISD